MTRSCSGRSARLPPKLHIRFVPSPFASCDGDGNSQLVARGDERQREAREAEGEVLRGEGLPVAEGEGKMLVKNETTGEREIKGAGAGYARRRAQDRRGEHAQPRHARTALDP